MKKWFISLLRFIKKDIWNTSGHSYSPFQYFLIRHLKVILIATRTFDQRHRRLQAASMTYYTALTLVPSLTIIYGLMKGFGLENTLRDQLYQNLSSHRQLLEAMFNMAQGYVDRTQGTIFAGIGLAILFWSIFQTLNTMEESFNQIWGIKEAKPLLRKLSDYLTIFMFCPMLIILSGSATVYASTQVHFISDHYFYLGPLASLVYGACFFIPFMVICLVFSFVYIFMPNRQVSFLAGLNGGVAAGILYQITQWGYIALQVWLTHSSAIYGSLAAVPLFLAWLQISWMIVLFGSEISFARQNLKTYEFGPEDIKPSPYLSKLIALLIMHTVVKNFHEEKRPLTAQMVSEHLALPARLTQKIITDLEENGLLCKIHLKDNEIFAYQPAIPIEEITVGRVCYTIEHLGQDSIPFKQTPELEWVKKKMTKAGENLL